MSDFQSFTPVFLLIKGWGSVFPSSLATNAANAGPSCPKQWRKTSPKAKIFRWPDPSESYQEVNAWRFQVCFLKLALEMKNMTRHFHLHIESSAQLCFPSSLITQQRLQNNPSPCDASIVVEVKSKSENMSKAAPATSDSTSGDSGCSQKKRILPFGSKTKTNLQALQVEYPKSPSPNHQNHWFNGEKNKKVSTSPLQAAMHHVRGGEMLQTRQLPHTKCKFGASCPHGTSVWACQAVKGTLKWSQIATWRSGFKSSQSSKASYIAAHLQSWYHVGTPAKIASFRRKKVFHVYIYIYR